MIAIDQTHRNVLCSVAILLILLFTAGNSQAYSKPEQLKFVSSNPADNPYTEWLLLVYTDALNRMDIELVFMNVPPKRASYYTDNGIADAELNRVADYNVVHPNMVRVDEHNFFINFVAYGSGSNIQLHGWESLKGTDYKVDYRFGIMKCEQQLVHVVEPHNLHATTDVLASFRKLFAGRIDVYVDSEDLADVLLKSDDFKELSNGQKVYRIGLMEKITGHTFLHKKHKALIPELSAILKNMKDQGLFTKYLTQVGLDPTKVNW